MAALSGDQSSEVMEASVLDDVGPTGGPRPALVDRGPATGHWTPRPAHRYHGLRLVVKRLVDLAVGGPILLLVAPLLALIAVAVRLTSPGPAIYRQVRVGRGGRRFTILKFRTMHTDADRRLREDDQLWEDYVAGGFKLSLDEDPRVTRLGALLRKTSLDELPQLVNIMRGDMSLVGPRPVVPEELEQYGPYMTAYLMAMPGLTGAWQVAGRDAVRFPRRALMDADYVDEWSLTSDLAILLRTLPAAISARDVR